MAVIVVALAVIGYALVSKRLAVTPVTAATVFLVLGVALGPTVLDVIHGSEDRRAIELVLETALALVLFTDALSISAGDWRRKGRLPGRLLAIGMPLTILIGWGIARWLFPSVDLWEAALIAICLAPTDAALGQAVVSDPRVPSLIRQALNVESGLNDGLALPFFLLALAAAMETEHVAGQDVVEVFVRSLVLASLVGLVGGAGVGAALRWSRSRGWIGREWTQIATLALIATVFAVADRAGGSGFIAAWVAGVLFGRVTMGRLPEPAVLAEDLGGLLATVAFLGFGAVVLAPVIGHITWQEVLYAILSLTVIRMVPVALSLRGIGLSRPTLLYTGWFGPRGLASIVFALLVAQEALPHGDVVVETVVVTVMMSVFLHGATAVVGARRYADWFAVASDRDPNLPEAQKVDVATVRRRLTTHASPDGS